MWFKKRHKKQKLLDFLEFTFLDELQHVPISKSLEENKKFLKELFRDCSDFVMTEFEIEQSVSAFACYIDGMIDSKLADQALKGLIIQEGKAKEIDNIQRRTLSTPQVQKQKYYGEFLRFVLSGDMGIIVDQNDTALLLGIRGMESRSIAEPETESVIRGPKEGFVENIRINTSLVRRKIKTPHLKMKSYTIGRHTNTDVVITYIDGIADPSLIEEIEKRLKKINIDGVLEGGYIEEYIQDNRWSPFPQLKYTERPDTVAGALLEGRAAIIVDGSPFAIIAPTVFWQLLQASEDYYERFHISTLIRWLRFTFLVLSLVMPAFYIAVTTFHQELIPTTLLLSIAASREAIPFPAVIEALIMEITFEALREAGVRLPKAVGQAVSILGALVVGTAAVDAGIVSAPMVIVVSATGIASFTIPSFNGAIALRMLRFPIMIIASMFGIYGILICLLFILGHLAGLRSFGVPYLAPVAPLKLVDLKDTYVRAPWPMMSPRPQIMHVQDSKRQTYSQNRSEEDDREPE